MVDLTVHAVSWCAHHGHPVLTLRTAGGERSLTVALAAEDAQALAVARVPGFTGGARAYDLVEAAVRGLGARLAEVRLQVGPNAVLRAALLIDGPGGELTLPAHFADGLTLAWRVPAPLRMAEADLARVPVSASPPNAHGASEAPAEPDAKALEPFRAFVASLDLGGSGNRAGNGER